MSVDVLLSDINNKQFLYKIVQLYQKNVIFDVVALVSREGSKLNIAAFIYLDTFLYQRKDFTLANKIITIALQYFPHNKTLLMRQVVYFKLVQDNDKLEQVFQTLFKLSCNDASYLYEYTSFALAKGNILLAQKLALKIIELYPDSEIACQIYACVLNEMQQYKKAIIYAEKAIKINPDFINAYGVLVSSLIKQGELANALNICNQLINNNKYNITILAYLSIIVQCSKNINNSYKTFTKFNYLAREFTLQEFDHNKLAKIKKFVLADQNLRYAPTNNATQNGWHSSFIDGDQDIEQLKQIFYTNAINFFKNIVVKLNIFSQYIDNQFSVKCWSVVMAEKGHQLPHIHPSAVVSGVFYISVPPKVNNCKEGWLRIGKAREDFYRYNKVYAPAKMIKPHVSKIVIFPSFLWHDTIPITASEQRISIAFDLIPVQKI